MTTPANISLTINGASVVYPSPTDGDWAGVLRAVDRRNADLQPGEGQTAETPLSERPGFFATPEAYLESVISQVLGYPNETRTPLELLTTCVKDWSTDPKRVEGEAPGASPAPTINSVPTYITNAQARIWLTNAGLFDAVNASIQAVNSTTLIKWEYANIIYRNDPLVEGLAQQLGQTVEQTDQFFIEAARL